MPRVRDAQLWRVLLYVSFECIVKEEYSLSDMKIREVIVHSSSIVDTN